MPRTKQSDGIHCPICEYEMETIVSAYHHSPFIDGCQYDHICDRCNAVPKTWHFEDKTNELVIYPWHPDKLCELEDLKAEGYFHREDQKRRVQDAIRAVKNSIKKNLDKEQKKLFVERSENGTIRTFIDPTKTAEWLAKQLPAEPRRLVKETKKRGPKPTTGVKRGRPRKEVSNKIPPGAPPPKNTLKR